MYTTLSFFLSLYSFHQLPNIVGTKQRKIVKNMTVSLAETLKNIPLEYLANIILLVWTFCISIYGIFRGM